MSSNDIKGLASVITDEISKLKSRAQEANEKLRKNTTQAHEAISHVENMNEVLGDAIDELKSALGQHTNSPPKEQA